MDHQLIRLSIAFCTVALLLTFVQGAPTLFLDVGNDTDYEFSSSTYSGANRLVMTQYFNRYVTGGCWCNGCYLDPESNNCTVPMIFEATSGGLVTIDDIYLNFSKSTTIAEVGYGNSFRKSDGACWEIQYHQTPDEYSEKVAVPEDYNLGTCPAANNQEYKVGTGPFATDDATQDAMFRLLNGTLDLDGDGVIDISYNDDNMTFHALDEIGVQTLWGPLRLRLVIWS